MIIINRLIKLKDKYPHFSSFREIFGLFLAKNLPLKINNLQINSLDFNPNDHLILEELQALNKFFRVNFLTPGETGPLAEIFTAIPRCSPLEFDALAEAILDNLICSPAKNLTGTFYTPQPVAELLVAETIQQELSPQLQILDPACGAGIFLKACLRKFQGTPEDKLNFIQSSLFGYDLNPLALEVSKFLLLVEALREVPLIDRQILLPDLNNNFICQNSLTADLKNDFDYIFCNPPFGLSRNQQIEAAELQLLTQKYNWLFSGKLNKYLLFICQCFQSLKANGHAGILTPNSWLGIRDGESLRKYLIREGAPEKLLCFEKKIFPKLGVETVITILSRKPVTDLLIKKFDSNLHLIKTTLLEHQTIRHNQKCIIPPLWDTSFSAIFNQIENLSSPLTSSLHDITPSIALQVYSQGRGSPPQSAEVVKNNSFHFDHSQSQNSYPYLAGKDLNSFGVTWSGKYLEYGPWVAEYQDLSRYNSPRLILREVLGKPPYVVKAALVTDTFLYNRSILHLHCPNQELLPILSVIMNSQLASFYFLIKGRKSNRKIFPKLVLDDLKDFPLPQQFDYDPQELQQLLQNPLSSENRYLLDKIVYKQYSLNPEQIKTIEDTLQEWKATF